MAHTPEPGFEETVKDGLTPFYDTFFGGQDKLFVDSLSHDLTRIRGTPCLYYVKRDQTTRIDGEAPGQDAQGIAPVLGLRARSGLEAVGAMYGEPVQVGNRIDSVRREITHKWNYADPVILRAIPLEPGSDEDADERGTTYAKTMRCDIARVEVERAGLPRPAQGDVIQFRNMLDTFYDVEDVSKDDSRFGGDGYFTVYQCSLVRNSKFTPPRKILPGGLGYEQLGPIPSGNPTAPSEP